MEDCRSHLLSPLALKKVQSTICANVIVKIVDIPTETVIVSSVRWLCIRLLLGSRGLTVAEQMYEPLSLDFNVVNVTDVLYMSLTPSRSDTMTLLALSVSEEWPLH